MKVYPMQSSFRHPWRSHHVFYCVWLPFSVDPEKVYSEVNIPYPQTRPSKILNSSGDPHHANAFDTELPLPVEKCRNTNFVPTYGQVPYNRYIKAMIEVSQNLTAPYKSQQHSLPSCQCIGVLSIVFSFAHSAFILFFGLVNLLVSKPSSCVAKTTSNISWMVSQKSMFFIADADVTKQFIVFRFSHIF